MNPEKNTKANLAHTVTSIPEYVDKMLQIAMSRGASDIHFDPFEHHVRARFRVDGILEDAGRVPTSRHSELIARLKVLSGLRTDMHMTAHDGRFRIKACDIRISIVPTQYGENAVLRLLPVLREDHSLKMLGFSEDHVEIIREAVKKPQGMILVTGPTGSGKTSTLYACLKMIDSEKISIITLEDPIEFSINGVRQIQVNPKYGLSFAQGLRAILRQDPDVIMVGEIRDRETADTAIHTALTGHMIVSTLHTNSAVDALPRLIDMGIEPYLIASTLSLVIAQRLVRKRCPNCAGNRSDDRSDEKSKKCSLCAGSGYSGRCVLSEVLPIDEKVRGYFMRKLSRGDIEKYMRSMSLRTMHEDGMKKVEEGVTTHEEVLRVLNNSNL